MVHVVGSRLTELQDVLYLVIMNVPEPAAEKAAKATGLMQQQRNDEVIGRTERHDEPQAVRNAAAGPAGLPGVNTRHHLDADTCAEDRYIASYADPAPSYEKAVQEQRTIRRVVAVPSETLLSKEVSVSGER